MIERGLDAIVITASGCGTTIKDYGHMFADDPAWRDRAQRVASLACDVSELMAEIGLANVTPRRLTVAYHSACSMQHGQKVDAQPMNHLPPADALTIKLSPPHELRVRVMEAGDRPIDHARVTLINGEPNLGGFAWGYSDSAWEDLVQGQTKADGWAAFSPLASGRSMMKFAQRSVSSQPATPFTSA